MFVIVCGVVGWVADGQHGTHVHTVQWYGNVQLGVYGCYEGGRSTVVYTTEWRLLVTCHIFIVS